MVLDQDLHFLFVRTVVSPRSAAAVRRGSRSFRLHYFKSQCRRITKMTVQATKNAPVQMVERPGPEIFKFETPGASLRGQLISIDSTEIDGKPTLRYIVKDGEDERLFSVLGTVDLNTKIRSS